MNNYSIYLKYFISLLNFHSKPLIIITSVVIFLIAPSLCAEPIEECIRKTIKTANTYYWFGVMEKGNMRYFQVASEYIVEADSLIQQADSIPIELRKDIEHEIQALKEGIEYQADMTHDTYYAVFPLVRLLTTTIFANPRAAGTYELIDEPQVIAVTNAASILSEQAAEKLKSELQFDVIFNSVPLNIALENEVLYIFNLSPRFYVHTFKDISQNLTTEEIEQYRAGSLPTSAKNKLCSAYGTNNLLLITINELDIIGKDYFYQVDGYIFSIEQDQPNQNFHVMALCHDRRGQFKSLLIVNVSLLLFAVLLYYLLIRIRTGAWPSFLQAISISISGFLLGRITPWIVFPIISSIAPAAEDLAKLSFWWTCIAGFMLLIFPVLIYRIASIRLKSIISILDMEFKGGAVGLTIAMGACAYLAGPLFLLVEGDAWNILIPCIVTASVLNYTIGRTLDSKDKMPLYFSVIPVVLALVFGPAILHLEPAYLWIVAGFSLPVLLLTVKKQTDKNEISSRQPELNIPVDVDELIQCARSPRYYELEIFSSIKQKAALLLKGKTVWLALVGENGVGKTATANALIEEIRRKLSAKKENLVLLNGECPQETGQQSAFIPFQKALSRYFGINLQADTNSQMQLVDTALDGLFESVVPFSSLFFPPMNNELNSASSEKEMFTSIVRTLRKLSQKNTVVLFIDDVQWIDTDSKKLLTFIIEAFPAEKPIELLIILTSRSKEAVEDIGLKNSIVEIRPPSSEEKVEMLNSTLGLDKNAANKIVSFIGRESAGKGELHWLFEVVAHLASLDAFVKEDRVFTWSKQFKKTDKLPIPQEFRDLLKEELSSHSQFRSLIECAACLGMEFNARLLTESLNISRLALLQQLEQIEAETGILFDVRETDDIYRFRSNFILSIIQEELEISGQGPKNKKTPQLIREYHAKVAQSFEKTLHKSSNSLFKVALHYFAAGASYADKALDYALRAAHTACEMYLHEYSRDFVKIAEECAEVLGLSDDFKKELLLIELHQAHVEGTKRDKAAEDGIAYLKDSPDEKSDVIIKIARACYDAMRFEDSENYARLAVERAASNIELAEGFQFIGISLSPKIQSEERIDYQRKALNLLKEYPEDQLDAQALLSRVYNSLAEDLSYGSPADKKEAVDLFNKSLVIKERVEIHDLPGQARCYGGLGRLAFFTNPSDVHSARLHFTEDLKISEKIGDIAGQAKMYSFLGACDVKEVKYGSALVNYIKSFELSVSTLDKFFAGAGLLEAACKTGNIDLINSTGNSIWEIAASSGIPAPCVSSLLKSLVEVKSFTDEEWYASLYKKLKEV